MFKKLLISLGILFWSQNIFSESNLDHHCLATMMYHEAKGEGQIGQVAVANVVINRTKTKIFPKSVCDVIYQKGQFSWVGKKKKINDAQTYERLLNLAKNVLYNDDTDHTNGALYFNGKNQRPPTKNLRVRAKIGNHIFYS